MVRTTISRIASITNAIDTVICGCLSDIYDDDVALLMVAKALLESVAWHDGFYIDNDLVSRSSRAKEREVKNEQQVQQ